MRERMRVGEGETETANEKGGSLRRGKKGKERKGKNKRI